MEMLGRIESLWRYPVKSMRGEELKEAFAGFAGIYGDRCYAFHSSAAPKGFPWLTSREHQQLLLYTPAYRDAEVMSRPPNLAEAEAMPPGATPAWPDPSLMMVDVQTPSGERLSIGDSRLIGMLREAIRDTHDLKLVRSDRPVTDCRPISLFSIQTVARLSRELEVDLDKRRFRANIYLDLQSGVPFAEDALVGRSLRLGPKAVVMVLERDPRCKMITLDPETAQANPAIMRALARDHESRAGVYAAVLIEGTLRAGDEITLL